MTPESWCLKRFIRSSLSDPGDDAQAKDWTLAGRTAPLISQMSEFWKGWIKKNLKRELRKRKSCIGWRKWKSQDFELPRFCPVLALKCESLDFILLSVGLQWPWMATSCTVDLRESSSAALLHGENLVLLLAANWGIKRETFGQRRPLEKIWLSW